MCENEEAMVEAARTYGNFSRVLAAREYMEQVIPGFDAWSRVWGKCEAWWEGRAHKAAVTLAGHQG